MGLISTKKACVDAVFRKDNFKNEAVWCYKENENATKHFPKKHDNLLFYSKTKDATFNVLRGEPTEAQLKRYNHVADEERYAYMKGKMRKLEGGAKIRDWWTIPIAQIAERTGWATQKPLALLQRIIKASSNEGDLVLDPFAGRATCCEAAEIEGRRWVGIEACEEATKIIRDRLDAADLGSLGRSRPRAIIKRSAPRRTDADAPPPEKPKPKWTTSYKNPENMQKLYGRQFGDCTGCGEHKRHKNFSFDHIHPRSKDGGDEIDNLQLLCSHCNSTKGVRDMERLWEQLYELRSPISPAGWKYLRQRGRQDWRIA